MSQKNFNKKQIIFKKIKKNMTFKKNQINIQLQITFKKKIQK